MKRPTPVVVATKREKNIRESRSRRECGDQSAILLRKVGGCKIVSQGEKFQINSIKAERGWKTEALLALL